MIYSLIYKVYRFWTSVAHSRELGLITSVDLDLNDQDWFQLKLKLEQNWTKPKHKSKRKMSIEAQRQTANVINQEYSKRILFWLRIHVYPSNYPSPNDLCRLLLVLSRNYTIIIIETVHFWLNRNSRPFECPRDFCERPRDFCYSAKGREMFVKRPRDFCKRPRDICKRPRDICELQKSLGLFSTSS